MNTPVPVSLVLVAHHPPLRPDDERDGGALLQRLCEHVIEGVLPMLRLIQGAPAPVTVALSQPWMEAMGRERVREAVEERLRELIQRCANLAEEHGETSVGALAEHDAARYREALAFYQGEIGCDPVGALAGWFSEGRVELIPVAGSHALLPLLERREMRALHLRAAAEAFERRFGVAPAGIWLPECAVGPNVLDALVDTRAGFTVVERRLLDDRRGVRLSDRVTLLGRDAVSATWPAQGADSRASGTSTSGSIWGWYARGDQEAPHRRVYDPELGRAHAAEVGRATFEALERATTLAWSVDALARAWFEWPAAWTALVGAGAESGRVSWVALSEQATTDLDEAPTIALENTSWHPDGLGPWLSPSNGWLIRHLHHLERRVLSAAAGRHLGERPRALPPWQRRAVQVALRELMMAQSSDLAAAMDASSGVAHALGRVRAHVDRAKALLDMVERDAVDGRVVEGLEEDETLAALVNLEWLRPSS